MGQLHLQTDAAFLNEIANHPEVRPWLGGEGPVDYGPIMAVPSTVAVANEHGGFLFHEHGPGRFEVHSQFLPEGRGRCALAAMVEARRFMFTATDCLELRTRVPANNRAAWSLARHAGFQESFRREKSWPTPSGERVDISFQVLHLERWRALDAELPALGHWFNEELERAKIAAGSKIPTHPDDEAHDRAVGAALSMAWAGKPHKALWAYNDWARFAAYAELELVSDAPVIIDIADAIIRLEPGRMEVVECRERQ